MRDASGYETLDDDDENKRLLDEVYPEILNDDDADDDDATESVSAFVARHLAGLAEVTDDIVRVRDVIRTRDDDDDDEVIDYQKSYEEFLDAPFTFPA